MSERQFCYWVASAGGGGGILVANGDLAGGEQGWVTNILISQNEIYDSGGTLIAVVNNWRRCRVQPPQPGFGGKCTPSVPPDDGKIDNIAILFNTCWRGTKLQTSLSTTPFWGSIHLDVSMTNSKVANNIVEKNQKNYLVTIEDSSNSSYNWTTGIWFARNIYWYPTVPPGQAGYERPTGIINPPSRPANEQDFKQDPLLSDPPLVTPSGPPPSNQHAFIPPTGSIARMNAIETYTPTGRQLYSFPGAARPSGPTGVVPADIGARQTSILQPWKAGNR